MPAEAIHLSAFVDSLAESPAYTRLAQPELLQLGRLGALVIDFPYFEHFPVGVARHFLKLPTAVSKWGEELHHGRPVLIAKSMLTRVRALAADGAQRAAERVLALALGFVSHLVVDASLHPLVNRLARARATRLGDHPLRQHSEVEKFQSVLFHEARNGFDFMGRPELAQHICVQAHAIHEDPVLCAAFCEGLQAALGRAPNQALLSGWARGYTQYVWLVSSVAGKTLAPEREKRALREEVYRGSWGSFEDAYREAVESSRRALGCALALVEARGPAREQDVEARGPARERNVQARGPDVFDREAEAAFDAALPAGAIDDM